MNEYEVAVKNIASFGDTDIFPYPVENALFFDKPNEVIALLSKINGDFVQFSSTYPVEQILTTIPVGQFGFRLAAQIDPLWNAFYLAKVLSISTQIEGVRVKRDKDAVFSYRIAIEKATGSLFSRDVSWRKYIEKTVEIASSQEFSFVVKFDISDFYSRIYHHRLQNAVKRVSPSQDTANTIMAILQDLSNSASYGLPVGGNGSRILAELLLNAIDQMLVGKRIRFCRYVDDFVLFAKTREEAFRELHLCVDFLMKNEGLSIQKTKTQILHCTEYVSQTKNLLEGDEGDGSKQKAAFLNLHIHYDPYSTTADDDYEELKTKLAKFDVNKLLKDEIRKSRIHQALGKQLLSAIQFLTGEELGLALKTISSNFSIFYPIFPSVLQVASKVIGDTPEPYRTEFVKAICKLVEEDSYICQGDNNAAYIARFLSRSDIEEADQTIIALYSASTSPLVRANCIYAMTNKRIHYWLSSLKASFITMSRSERRAFIIASYVLGDEGRHWRDHSVQSYSEFENLVREWAASKFQSNQAWILPL